MRGSIINEVEFLLNRNEILDSHLVQTFGNLLFMVHPNQSYIPAF